MWQTVKTAFLLALLDALFLVVGLAIGHRTGLIIAAIFAVGLNAIAYWNTMSEHPNYDEYWQKRNLLPHLKNVAPAVMTVGGWYDAEDLYGALKTYRAIEDANPGIFNVLVMGPWLHGGWARLRREMTLLKWLAPKLTIAIPDYEFVWSGSKKHQQKLAGYKKIHLIEFIDAIRNQRPCVPSFLDGARAQAVMDGAVQSASEHRWVDLPNI